MDFQIAYTLSNQEQFSLKISKKLKTASLNLNFAGSYVKKSVVIIIILIVTGIVGQENTPYAGGVFKLALHIPDR